MSNIEEIERLREKTAERRFLQTLEQDFQYSPKIAQAILDEAQACLQGTPERTKLGQQRVLLTIQRASHGGSLSETAKKEVIWTVDGGAEDLAILHEHGQASLRRVQIQRLLDEALEQGAVATQEDLARTLKTSVRTIKRDFAVLQEQGQYLPSRGYRQGIGRGQTHKSLIVRRWLQGDTYDQLMNNTHHCVTSIQRYVRTFTQVVALHVRGLSDGQISLALQIGQALVRDYLLIYAQNDQPECRERLADQLARLRGASVAEKGAQ
jgi:transcription initiation factor IIE alpha subunit